jgi:ubiquitin carboxyl-terminal hydrolase 20/33
LCIHLKRYRCDSLIPSLPSKIATHVQFPMEDLDMRPYCKDLPELSDRVDTSNITKYDLYGLINHRGGGIGGMKKYGLLIYYVLF